MKHYYCLGLRLCFCWSYVCCLRSVAGNRVFVDYYCWSSLGPRLLDCSCLCFSFCYDCYHNSIWRYAYEMYCSTRHHCLAISVSVSERITIAAHLDFLGHPGFLDPKFIVAAIMKLGYWYSIICSNHLDFGRICYHISYSASLLLNSFTDCVVASMVGQLGSSSWFNCYFELVHQLRHDWVIGYSGLPFEAKTYFAIVSLYSSCSKCSHGWHENGLGLGCWEVRYSSCVYALN